MSVDLTDSNKLIHLENLAPKLKQRKLDKNKLTD